jgi:hypothetical protein
VINLKEILMDGVFFDSDGWCFLILMDGFFDSDGWCFLILMDDFFDSDG